MNPVAAEEVWSWSLHLPDEAATWVLP